MGLLDSACHRPQASFFGQEAYPALAGKAAALMHSLACNRALVNGDERLALLATVVFLRINGYVLDLTDDEAFDLTMSVAAGQLDAGGIQDGFDSRQPLCDLRDPCILARVRLHIRFCRCGCAVRASSDWFAAGLLGGSSGQALGPVPDSAEHFLAHGETDRFGGLDEEPCPRPGIAVSLPHEQPRRPGQILPEHESPGEVIGG